MSVCRHELGVSTPPPPGSSNTACRRGVQQCGLWSAVISTTVGRDGTVQLVDIINRLRTAMHQTDTLSLNEDVLTEVVGP